MSRRHSIVTGIQCHSANRVERTIIDLTHFVYNRRALCQYHGLQMAGNGVGLKFTSLYLVNFTILNDFSANIEITNFTTMTWGLHWQRCFCVPMFGRGRCLRQHVMSCTVYIVSRDGHITYIPWKFGMFQDGWSNIHLCVLRTFLHTYKNKHKHILRCHGSRQQLWRTSVYAQRFINTT